MWKKIPNFSRYEASTDGRIRSINYKNSGKKKILKPSDGGDGYLKTMLLNDDGKYCSWGIHKWIAFTFLGPRPKGLQINHKNGIKTDNSVKNLEYCSRSENIKHAFDNGLIKPKRGELNGMSKLTKEDVIQIRKTAKNGGRYYGRKKLAEQYGVSEAHIKDVVNGRRGVWSHI